METRNLADAEGGGVGKGHDPQASAPAHHQQRASSDSQLEVTQVTPFRSEDGTHTLYALACRKGDRQWRIIERYSGIRRVYDIARVSYPFVENKGVPFPGRVLVQSSAAALQRAEALLLWLSSFSHVPVVADFLMGDRSMTSGAVSLRTQSPVHSLPSNRSRSEASTVGQQRAGHEDGAGKSGTRGAAGEESEEAEAGSSRSTPSAMSGSSRRPSMDGSGSSRGVGANDGASAMPNSGCSGRRARVAFLPAPSPVTELSACSASPISAKDSVSREALFPDGGAKGSVRSSGSRQEIQSGAPSTRLTPGAAAPADTQEQCAATRSTAPGNDGAQDQPLDIFDRTPSQAQTISSELNRLLNSSNFWRAGRLMGQSGTDKGAGKGQRTGLSAEGSPANVEQGGIEVGFDGARAAAARAGAVRRFWVFASIYYCCYCVDCRPACQAGGRASASSARVDAGGGAGAAPVTNSVTASRDFKTVSLRAKAEQWLLKPEEVTVGKRMGQVCVRTRVQTRAAVG